MDHRISHANRFLTYALWLFWLLLLPAAQAQDVTISIGSETGVHADALIANADRCAMEVGVAYEAHQLPPGEWINSILPTEAAVRSGLYDIAYIPISKIPQFVAAEYLLPLEDFDIDALDPDDVAAGIQGLNIISTPSIPEWGSMVRGDVLPRNLSTFISGESTVEETAATIEAKILQILRDGGHIES